MTDSADHTLSDIICVNQTISIMCNVLNLISISHISTIQYQWSINEGGLETGNDMYTIPAPSHIQSIIKVTCVVFIKLNSGISVGGSDSIIIQPKGKTLNYSGYCTAMFLFIMVCCLAVIN